MIEVFQEKHFKMIEPIGGWDDLMKKPLFLSLETDQVKAYSIVKENKVIAIFGFVVIWEGVSEVFTIMCKDIKEHGFLLYKTFKSSIEKMFEKHNFRRVQATVFVEFEAAINMVERLGFKREGLLRKWLPNGNDVYMYAWVK